MPEGWETLEVVRSDPRGSWSVVERGASYREVGQRAMMWRGHDEALAFPLSEAGWVAERMQPPFQQVIAHGAGPRPYLIVERVWGIRARHRLQLGPAPLAEALGAGVFLCRALAELAAVTTVSGEPLGVRGVALGLDDLWLTPEGPRLRNALRTAKMLSALPTTPEDIDQLAPEHVRAAPPGEPERDVYAVAMAVLSLVRGRSPLLRETVEHTAHALLAAERELPLQGLPDSLRATLMRALDPNPQKRPPNEEALEAEWREVAASLGVRLSEHLPCPGDASFGWLWS
ncbi:MAG: hypothetical protein AB8I08_23395 [Sandaracinaceae bacterium]